MFSWIITLISCNGKNSGTKSKKNQGQEAFFSKKQKKIRQFDEHFPPQVTFGFFFGMINMVVRTF